MYVYAPRSQGHVGVFTHGIYYYYGQLDNDEVPTSRSMLNAESHHMCLLEYTKFNYKIHGLYACAWRLTWVHDDNVLASYL